MQISHQKISGWGNYPQIQANVATPDTLEELQQYIISQPSIITRGNGKSYGDASLGSHVVSTSRFKKLISFDSENGIVECESGMLLAELLPIIVPEGWFFQVTPGIKNITIGGAIASDVHGKNHPGKACFSSHLLSFKLMQADGQMITCSRTENTDVFWQSCGGMGWSGVITSARIQLMRISSTRMNQRTIRCENLEQLFKAFSENESSAYAAAWVDTTSKGKSFGRGALHLADHQTGTQALNWPRKKAFTIPAFAPEWLLNSLTIRVFNELIYRRNKSQDKIVEMDAFFYPLDVLNHWNRMYGRRGLVQYQFCLPENQAFEGMQKILNHISRSSETPFLSVLKRHGDRPPEAINSFPIKGYSLALDFPRTKGICAFAKELDEMVWSFNGKIYLTKDACSKPKMGRVDPHGFSPKFSSALRERIS